MNDKPSFFRRQWNSYCEFHKTILQPIEGMLAIAAIVFAGIQFQHSKNIIDTSKQLNLATTELANQAANKYVGNFPENIKGIDTVMDQTCRELNIMVDFAAYGGYSAKSPNFEDYAETLRKVARSTWDDNKSVDKCNGISKGRGEPKTKVKLLLFAPSQRRKALEDQIGEDFLDPKKYPGATATFKEFFAKNLYLIPHDTPEAYLNKMSQGKEAYAGFITKLEEANRHEETNFSEKGIEIRFSSEQYLLYLWIHDKKEAAYSFSLHRPSQDLSVETTFSTRDPDLLRTFDNLFQDEWSHACHYDCYYDPGECSQKDKQSCEEMKPTHQR